MKIPTATYRIQFRNGMTFDRAAALVPYMKRLGISHLYASPIFTATSGSTHGYDVTDANEIEPAIGGREGFDRMVKALKAAGLGLILDIVPNHMAASLENPWWRDVIEQGESSRYARHFDIDWSRRLTLPFLGDTFERVLENGDISVKRDAKSGKPALAYFESHYPLVAESWQGREEAVLKLTDKAALADLHERQPWRLTSWRDARRDLSYRRFFEITGLVGVRVEDDAVFDDSHRLILELVQSGAVDGLRIDHVDGLADPNAYLTRLRQQAGPECYITVEKILGEGEHLPEAWPISGTTGYEFIASLSDALVDGKKIAALRSACDQIVGAPVDMAAELRNAKLLMADKNFEGEFTTLLKLAVAIANAEHAPLDESAARAALRELLVAFPVYRTYGTAEGLPADSHERLQQVVETVKRSATAPDPAALDFLVRILTGDVAAAEKAATFRIRFQQLTGPLMAKSIEDTLFFRQNMALALNEVGAEPLPRDFSLDRFHAEMETRLARQPDALSGTSSHDTKRGEDARARLYTLTEAPDLWRESVARWRGINAAHVHALDDGPAPEPAVEWLLYQALAGVWPTTLQPDDDAGLKALEERFIGFVGKALREAKLRTNWGDSNDAYEQAVLGYARHLLVPSSAFLRDFTQTLQPFVRAGLVNGVTQTVIKLTAPGVPDIYQGSERLDFSLVDPDNRREPDFDALQQLAENNQPPAFSDDDAWYSGRVKQQVIANVLALRQQKPSLFGRGDYLPLPATGKRAAHYVAFARTEGDDALIVVAPRLAFDIEDGGPAEAEVALPATLANRRYRNVFSGEDVSLTDRVHPQADDGRSPVILLSL
ncbi:malto-oligosyltrehalose synthase [Erwinia sp. 9145]|uniref:malto-oligosyltrehalose synthase n=1 Tax=Erwinia sp. 9145 TaxID=1500895 RepID=UPI000555AB91|nr:malto-oligosyltrehalose synthase [Erwinia sp. 9145]